MRTTEWYFLIHFASYSLLKIRTRYRGINKPLPCIEEISSPFRSVVRQLRRNERRVYCMKTTVYARFASQVYHRFRGSISPMPSPFVPHSLRVPALNG